LNKIVEQYFQAGFRRMPAGGTEDKFYWIRGEDFLDGIRILYARPSPHRTAKK
jgi:hypothetical protein